MTEVTATSSDAAKSAALGRMKLFALGLLLAAAVLFAVARANEDGSSVWGYVRAFAEAAMVGALADWFAVTALFRHPLRIPIPHTAIIPNRKDEIGRSLGEFVETNFMSREILDERLAGIDVGRRLGEWLAEPDHAVRASIAVADVIRGAIEVIDDTQVQEGIERIVESRIRSTAIAPLLGKTIDLAIEGGHHQRLLDAIFTALQGFLADNRVTFRERLEQESPWWVPDSIDDRIFAKIYDGVTRFLVDVGVDGDHEVRHSIEQRVESFADRLRTDPDLLAKGEQLKDEILAHPDVQAWISSLWRDAKRGLIDAASRPESELRERIAVSLAKLGERLRDEPELQAKIDRWVTQAVGYVVENYRSEVSKLIESTVARWDGESTSRKLELQVGRDQQFIRINGTIVGGLAGLVIHTLGNAFF
ncbi:MAG: hypothetical protein JWN39_2403 [Ilumatobacteraceae bacterium]|nr:hypothetical protein [Ilumatobacteraceae bacterium]